MINKQLNAYITVISHKRAGNVTKIQDLIGDCSFYVNKGEYVDYISAGAKVVYECGDNIVAARNKAIQHASELNLPCIQVSDDLRSLKRVSLINDKHVVEPVTFTDVVLTLLHELKIHNFNFGGVAVTTNRLNYTGKDTDYNKLVVNDLICIMPNTCKFDEAVALKEDYDLTISELLTTGGVVRCNNFLCDFPHRDNDGGANTYRNNVTEQAATEALHAKWGDLIKKHPTRDGQISLNYKKIAERKAGQQVLF